MQYRPPSLDFDLPELTLLSTPIQYIGMLIWYFGLVVHLFSSGFVEAVPPSKYYRCSLQNHVSEGQSESTQVGPSQTEYQAQYYRENMDKRIADARQYKENHTEEDLVGRRYRYQRQQATKA